MLTYTRANCAYTFTTLYLRKRERDRATERVKHAARTVWKGKGWNTAVGLCNGVR